MLLELAEKLAEEAKADMLAKKAEENARNREVCEKRIRSAIRHYDPALAESILIEPVDGTDIVCVEGIAFAYRGGYLWVLSRCPACQKWNRYDRPVALLRDLPEILEEANREINAHIETCGKPEPKKTSAELLAELIRTIIHEEANELPY